MALDTALIPLPTTLLAGASAAAIALRTSGGWCSPLFAAVSVPIPALSFRGGGSCAGREFGINAARHRLGLFLIPLRLLSNGSLEKMYLEQVPTFLRSLFFLPVAAQLRCRQHPSSTSLFHVSF